MSDKKLPKLDDFIAQSLGAVLDGINHSQEKYRTIELGIVSPYFGELNDDGIKNSMQRIDFEVAVEVSESSSKSKEGKVDIRVVSGALGGSGERALSNAATIRFGINFVPPMIQTNVNKQKP